MVLPTVLLGFYGSTLDSGATDKRWTRWRPTVSALQHEDLLVQRLELLVPAGNDPSTLVRDLAQVSPETEVRQHSFVVKDPWDFEEQPREAYQHQRRRSPTRKYLARFELDFARAQGA